MKNEGALLGFKWLFQEWLKIEEMFADCCEDEALFDGVIARVKLQYERTILSADYWWSKDSFKQYAMTAQQRQWTK